MLSIIGSHIYLFQAMLLYIKILQFILKMQFLFLHLGWDHDRFCQDYYSFCVVLPQYYVCQILSSIMIESRSREVVRMGAGIVRVASNSHIWSENKKYPYNF